MGNQERILRIDDHQVLHADQRHELLGAKDVVVDRVDGKMAVGLRDISFAVAAQGLVILVGAVVLAAAGIWALIGRFRPARAAVLT